MAQRIWTTLRQLFLPYSQPLGATLCHGKTLAAPLVNEKGNGWFQAIWNSVLSSYRYRSSLCSSLYFAIYVFRQVELIVQCWIWLDVSWFLKNNFCSLQALLLWKSKVGRGIKYINVACLLSIALLIQYNYFSTKQLKKICRNTKS